VAQETFADWDSASSSNSTIEGDATDGSVSIAEGCAPGNVNNAIRALMAACNAAFGGLPSGTSRPSYLTAGRFWMDTTSATAPVIKLYDGSDDITVFTFNYTSNTVTFGGSITGFDIVGLTALTAPAADDAFPIYDLSATTNKKIIPEDLLKIIDVITAETAPAVGDEVAIYDASASDSRKMTLANLFKIIGALTAETAPATGDIVALYDASATDVRAMTLANLLKVINSLTEDSSPDGAADFVVTYDASASAVKKVALNNLLSGSAGQIVYAQSATETDVSTAMPSDNTIPQNTEGEEIVTAAITPANASSTLLIECTVMGTLSNNGTVASVAVFVDSDADALGATGEDGDSSKTQNTIVLTFSVAAGSTSARTYKLRAGPSAGTLYINQAVSSASRYSTAGPVCTMKITEILP
jgi:hypothetical protein